MKGKGYQQTYWLVGECPENHNERFVNRERKRALLNENLLNGPLDNNNAKLVPDVPRSSLKNKSSLVRSPLPRCSSLESPKRLRFASADFIQQPYKTDIMLLEVIADNSPCKKSSGSLVENSLLDCCSDALRTSSTSCPCIENLANSTATLAHSQLFMLTRDEKPSYLSVPSLYTASKIILNSQIQIQTISAPVSPSKRTTALKSVCEYAFSEENPWNDVTPLLKKALGNENRI